MTNEPNFLRRFEQIRTSLRRYQGRLGLAATLLAAATGLGFLAWSDYYHELSRPTRAVGLAIAGLITLGVAWRWLIAPLRWWTKPRTAVEIEGRFPQLGQRIRTVVQYTGRPGDRIAEEGVKPTLVEALQDETEERVAPLPLGQIVRWRRAFGLAALAAVPIALLAFAAIRSAEWRTAIQRAVLIERPYTTIEVKPGNVLIDQGADVPVVVELKGRPRKRVVVDTRPLADKGKPWEVKPGLVLDKGPISRIATDIKKVRDPLEYRVVVDRAAEGSTFAIRVRYPLAIKEFDVQVAPPAYTGLDPKTTKGGDVQAVEGSVATFKIAFDDAPSEASLEIVDPARKSPKAGQPAPGPTILPLKKEGDRLVASLDLTRDLDYKVVARTEDGRILPKNKFRIDVREDRAPRVSFDEPDEALEVHPIAEVRHRVRVDDDFGLTKAGIVFRFNDGEEKTLTFRDFPLEKGQKKPKTSATLEEVLLLETLNATPLDSVTYYAFAEDNFPGTPRRTETDLRYIDLRVFKREYKLAEPGSGDGDPAELIALNELIARQRINLNRANRLAKRRANDRTQAEDPLKLAGSEETLLNLTKDFTEGVEQLADARVDSLHKALDAMQASIDSLDRSRFEETPPAMAEALKNLVKARRDLLYLIGSDSAMAAAMRRFDRTQAQKIRKPKSKDEEAEEIADRLEELAQEEDLVYATIASSMGGSEPAPKAKGQEGETTEPKEAEKKDAEAKEKSKGEGQQGKDGPKGEGEQGKDGPKGQGEPSQGDQGKEGPTGQSGSGKAKGEAQGGEGTEGEGGQGEKKLDRRGVSEKQEQIADEVRDLEGKLKALEVASDLAKNRMARAAEKVEKVSGDLNRGNTEEAAVDAKAGAGMLHELARQVKGEIAKEATDELAMARDLAEELARRESELADRAQGKPSPGNNPGEKGEKGQGKEKGEVQEKGKGQGKEKGEGQGPGEEPGQGDSPGSGQGDKPGPGGTRGGVGGWDVLTEAEQVERMAEMARTLEGWLKQIDKKGENKAADAVREILEKGNVAEIVERSERMGDLVVGGKREELGKEARELANRLEILTHALELLHRGIVAPQLAAMVEFDRRIAELTAKLADLKTEAEVAAWKREAATLIRDLEKAGIEGADKLADALGVAGGWHWDDRDHHYLVPESTIVALRAVSVQIKDRVQELILKDLASARDEATPPMFRELVERYYEVISKGTRAK